MHRGIKVLEDNCRGCVNCIKSCPTEAMRVIHGKVRIIEELCIGCGECLRSCRHRALKLDEDEWESILQRGPAVITADPAFCLQFPWSASPSSLAHVLRGRGIESFFEESALAFDVAALAISKALEAADESARPLISTYCPAVVRLVQMRFPELLKQLVPVETPLEFGVDLWRAKKQRKDDVTLIAPCPAKIAMVRDPVGRKVSSIEHAVSVGRAARELLAMGQPPIAQPQEHGKRWLSWSVLGGETRHVRALSSKPFKSVAVSGLRNVIDLLQEIELERLKGVDYVECRVCDLGCVGGMGNAESRFLATFKVETQEIQWEISPEEREELEDLYRANVWAFQEQLKPFERLSLGEELPQAMEKLKELHAVYAELPHIDCGACGRPTCKAMAEDIIRGQGEVEDCIFKLRERISELAEELLLLSRRLVHARGENKH